ncbi:MAG: TSUP family transporter [Myxococcaceae bacterium]
METEYLGLLIGVSFVAGVVDSIAGGGGLITLPALLFAGVPPTSALGTTKFFSACGSSVSVLNFARKKLITWKLLGFGICFTLLGGFLGSRLILLFKPEVVQVLILIFLPLAAASLFWKRQDHPAHQVRHEKKKTGILALGMGLYDGFFGPGTGAFLTLGFYHVLGLNLLHASALSKPFNLISNLAALSIFCFYGKVIWGIAIPMAFANMLGNWAGSQLAISQGALLVRKALLGVCVLLFVSLGLKTLKACHVAFFGL